MFTEGSDKPGGRRPPGGSLSNGKVERVQQKGHVVRAWVLGQSKHEFKSQFRHLDVVGLAVLCFLLPEAGIINNT